LHNRSPLALILCDSVHAGVLLLLGRFNTKVWAAYSIFYALGTVLAIQIPVVGWTPLKSLEQLGPCAMFFGYQLMQFCEILRKRQGLGRIDSMKLRVQVFGAASVIAVLLFLTVAPSGYFGPMSARVRGLFVKHTKTGNPLVDSVAEHQPASSQAYFQYLHHICTLAPIGYLLVMANLSDASSFLIVWATTAYFFSHKMVRLILLTAPIGSILAGIGAARIFAWSVNQWWQTETPEVSKPDVPAEVVSETDGKFAKDAKKKKAGKKPPTNTTQESSFEGLHTLHEALKTTLKTKEGVFIKRSVALLAIVIGWQLGTAFVNYSFRIAVELSNPSIIVKARDNENRVIKVDDYRQAYWWLRDNTPEDARIMAWWDYGYQIGLIANRTTLADGNTWNHEHIALLGLTLTTDFDEGYEIARHWADYVLVWAGGRGDDMAKSPHLARIANSVYRDHCPDDPTCRRFGFIDRQGTPSPMMARSLLYRLHSHKLRPGVEVPEDKFTEVYRSKHGWVRIYKIVGVSEESKAWSADVANKKCDAGGWYCPGSYPPAMEKFLARKKDFQQLEDFNRGGVSDEEYTKRYFEDLQNPQRAHRNAAAQDRLAPPPKADVNVDEIYQRFEDTDDTTLMWQLISSNSYEELKAWLAEEPHKAFIRSSDKRGPMWWSFEHRNERITDLLMKAGVPHTDPDAKGLTPVDLLGGGNQK
jgi:dolichyl-diphosphooligosaccharide--protein glycosyltransferase